MFSNGEYPRLSSGVRNWNVSNRSFGPCGLESCELSMLPTDAIRSIRLVTGEFGG